MREVTVSIDYYEMLVRENECIEAVRRLVNSDTYVTVDNILALLGIKREEKGKC